MTQEVEKLIEAIRARKLTEVRAILAVAPMTVYQLYEGRMPLVEAVGAGADYVTALISSGADVNGRDGKGNTALLRACEKGDVNVVRALLAAKADPDAFNGTVQNPLRAAVSTRSPRHLNVLKELIASGANVNALSRSKFGNPTSTPLVEACCVGNVEAAQELVAAGADVNASVMFGTALTGAAKEGHENVIKVLLAAGADPAVRVPIDRQMLKEGIGKTAAELARMNGHSRVVEMLSADPSKRECYPCTDVSAAWERLETALATSLPLAHSTLQLGADDEDVIELAAARGEGLPDFLEHFFKRHNGQAEFREAHFIRPDDMSFTKFRFMLVSEVIREWRMWSSLSDSGEFQGRQVLSDPGVKPLWYHRDWIPLSSDGLGNSHCLDLSPAAEGKAGQIILLWHDQEHRPKVADSLARWLNDLAKDVELLRVS